MILSATYANQYLNFLLGKTASITAPTQVWAALSTNNPEGGTFTEVSGNGYSRVLISLKGETYPAEIGTASDRNIKNVKQISFPKATGAYTVLGIGLFSAETGGTPFAYGALTNSDGTVNTSGVAVAEGAVPLFEASAFNIYMPDGN